MMHILYKIKNHFLRKRLKSKGILFKIRDYGTNNKIILVSKNGERELNKSEATNGIEITVNGCNNIIKISENIRLLNNHLYIFGSNNLFEVAESAFAIKATTIIFQNTNNAKLIIAPNISVGSAKIVLEEDDSSITIGSDCMLSDDIKIRASDGHSIIDNSGNITNKGHDIIIGNHVWLGFDVTILKNVTLADNLIVGAGSLVTKSFKEPNVIIAGVPAKIIKTGINWDRRPIKNYCIDNKL